MPILNRDSPTPLYAQVKQRLLSQIEGGGIKVGEKLPAEAELERAFGVSRITIRRAVGDLVAAGYVRRQPGFGTIVMQSRIRHDSGKIGGFHNDLVAQGFDVQAELLDYDIGPPDDVAALHIGAEPDQNVLYARKLIRANGVPVVLGTSYHVLPDHVRPPPDEARSDSLFTILRRYGLVFQRAERSIEARLPEREDANLLEISRGTPVLLIELHAYGDDDMAVSYVRSVYRGDRYKYMHTLGP